MKLFLHIGMSKAGSTAIQKALTDHHEALREWGACYPLSGQKRGYAHYEIKDEIVRKRSTEALGRALRECGTSATGILSCEGFWLFNDPQVEQLAQALKEHDTTVVVYLRQPVGYLRSSYRQAVKTGRTTLRWSEYFDTIGDRMDYPVILRRWRKWFKVRAEVYERVRDSIEQDFCNLIGLGRNGAEIERGMVNVTPCDGVLRCILQVNRRVAKPWGRRLRRMLLGRQSLFRWLPELEDREAALSVARRICHRWDITVLEEFLSADGIRTLLPPSISSGAEEAINRD